MRRRMTRLFFTVDEDVVMEIPTPVYLEKQLLQGLVIKKKGNTRSPMRTANTER